MTLLNVWGQQSLTRLSSALPLGLQKTAAAAATKLLQSCLTLSDPMDCSLPGSRWTFVGKVMSLLLNMLSRWVITFLPRSKHLLVSWLQSYHLVNKY